jgi:hypothetical protein
MRIPEWIRTNEEIKDAELCKKKGKQAFDVWKWAMSGTPKSSRAAC